MTPRRVERRKLNAVLFGICVLFVLLGGRLYYIQVLCHEQHFADADAQTRVSVELAARRGDVTDRCGRRLATSVPAYIVAASIPDVSDPAGTARLLARVLELDEARLLRRLRSGARFVYVKRKVPVEIARRIEAARNAERLAGRSRLLTGIHLLPDSRRRYTCGRSACHTVGFTRWFPKTGDTGQAGAEGALDTVLRGTPGIWELRRDGRSRSFGLVDERLEQPVPGCRVALTIDLPLQQALEDELAELAAKYRPAGAFGLIMDPWSGRVLAMASWPDFDPNRPGDCAEGGRLNRTLTTVLEPGSTMKPLVAAGALEEGVFKTTDRIFCENGSWKPRPARTITDAHGYGWLTFAGAVVKSSNIGLAKVGQKMGNPRLERYCRAFGFGRPSGLGLPGESRGVVRPLREWTRDSALSVPFGHEVSVTPLQLAAAYCALANGGVLYRPQIVQRIEDHQGALVQDFPPVPVGRVISRKTSETMREILREVVQSGTGRRAQLKDWKVAGKTGTARKLVNGRYSDEKHFSSFVGFAPADQPRAVVLITVDEPQGAYYGGTVAGPAVASVLGRTMTHLRVPPEGRALAEVAGRSGAGSR